MVVNIHTESWLGELVEAHVIFMLNTAGVMSEHPLKTMVGGVWRPVTRARRTRDARDTIFTVGLRARPSRGTIERVITDC